MSNQLINKPPLGTPLNRSHPLAQGMVGCWIFNEGGGDKLLNHVTQRNGSILNGTWIGQGLYFNGTNTEVTTDITDSWDSSVSYSWVVLADDIGPWVGKKSGNWEYIINAIGGPGIRFQRYNTSGNNAFQCDSSAFSDRYSLASYVLVYDAAAAYAYIYRRGIRIGSASYGGSAFQIRSTTYHTIGIGYGTGYYTGTIYFMAYYKKALSPSETMSLYIDPYQMFRPSMPYWFWSSDVATITGTLAGSLDRLAGDLDGTITVTGTISGELDRFTGAWTGIYGKTDIQLSGELDRLTGSFSGVCQVNAALAGALGRLTGDFSGVITVTGTLGGSLDRLSGELRGFYGSYGRRGLYIEIGLC